MKTEVNAYSPLIEECYKEYRIVVRNYIACRIPHREDAEDLMQDVFLRLLEYKQLINRETLQSFIFTIARNLVTDNLRLHYKKEEYITYMYDNARAGADYTEQAVRCNELMHLVDSGMKLLSDKRRETYSLSFNDGLTVAEIAGRLQITYRTAECHLFLARKVIRRYIAGKMAG